MAGKLRELVVDSYFAAIGMRPRPIFRELMHNLSLSPEQISELQRQRLDWMLRHCLSEVPYYRTVATEPRLDCFPVLRKETIDANYDQLIAEKRRSGRERVATGSGTTRVAMRVLLDRNSLAWARAARWRSHVLRGLSPHERCVHLERAPYNVGRLEIFKRRIGQAMMNVFILDAYRLDEERVRSLHARIRRLRPGLLGGFTSALLAFARISKSLGLPPPPHVKLISAYGENVFPEHRAALTEWFGVPVVSGYGAREVGLAAFTCSEWNYHVHSELVDLEVLCDDGAVRRHGTGRLLITTLRNEVMPLVRYNIGDIGTLSLGSCPCGLPFPVLSSIEGRSTELISLPDGSLLSSNAISRIFMYLNLLDWRVTQDSPAHIAIEVQPTAEWGSADEEKWRGDIKRLCGEQLAVDFRLVDAISPTAGGKRPNVVSLLEQRY